MATGHPPRRPSLAHTPRRRRRGGAARWVRGGGADRGAASESGRPAAERAPSGCLCWVRRAGRWRRGRVGRRWLPHGRAPEQAIDAYPHTPPGIPPDVLPRRTLRACGGGGGLPGGSVAGGRRRPGRPGGQAAATRRSARLLAGMGAGGSYCAAALDSAYAAVSFSSAGRTVPQRASAQGVLYRASAQGVRLHKLGQARLHSTRLHRTKHTAA